MLQASQEFPTGWNAALAALAVLSGKQPGRWSPSQRDKALEQLWRNQALMGPPMIAVVETCHRKWWCRCHGVC